MRRSLVVLVAILAVVLAAGPAAAARRQVDIRKVDLGEWPLVSVTVASRGVEKPKFVLSENNVPATTDVEVASFTETGQDVDVVLVIDTSGSMEGAPLASALDAARTFVQSVPDNIRIGVVTFSDSPVVALPLTLDRERTLSVLAAPVAQGETALYDAVTEAADMFSGNAQRNMVVLSDGGDTASKTSLDSAVSATRDAGTTVYSLGLTSGEADEAALRRLAAGPRSRYSPVDTADLTTLYEGLAAELKNQYTISYRSAIDPGTQFTLQVATEGATDSAELLAPRVAVPSESRQSREVEAPPLLRGTAGLVIVLALFFVSLSLIGYSFLGARSRRHRDAELSRLMAATPMDHRVQDARSDEGPVAWLPDSLVGVADQVAKNKAWSRSLERNLDRGGVGVSGGEFLAGCFVTAIAGGVVATAVSTSLLIGVVVAAVAAVMPYLVLSVKVSRRYSSLQSQLPDILMILASSLRAGHSFVQALDAVAAEIGDPGAREFSRLVAEIRLGRPVTDAMNDLAERIGSEDFRWAVLAVNVQREVGGNLAEVLDTVANTMRGRDDVRRQVKVLSAEGRLSMYILGALPVLVALYLRVVNPSYLSLMYETRIGLVLLGTAACLYILGFVWMRKVVKIHV